MEDDKNCQINRRPMKSKKDMQLKKPAKLQSSYKKKELKYMYEDKNSQDTMCEYDDSKSQATMKKMFWQELSGKWKYWDEAREVQK